VESERLFEGRIRELMAPRPAGKFHRTSESDSQGLVENRPEDLGHHIAGRHEFAFVTSGQGRVKTPREEFILSAGDLLLIGPGIDHVELPTEPPHPYVMCWCELDHSYATIGDTSYSPPESYLAGAVLELHGRTNVQSLAVAIDSELANRAWGWRQAVRALLQYLGCILIRRIQRGQSMHLVPSESPAIAHDPGQWEVIQSALAYCRANFSRGVRVEEVARAVGYSTSRLSHLFSSYLGESVADHVRGLRLARARDLLESTDHTVADIAHRVGYGDPAHFTRAFVRAFHLPPNAYRQRLRGQ